MDPRPHLPPELWRPVAEHVVAADIGEVWMHGAQLRAGTLQQHAAAEAFGGGRAAAVRSMLRSSSGMRHTVLLVLAQTFGVEYDSGGRGRLGVRPQQLFRAVRQLWAANPNDGPPAQSFVVEAYRRLTAIVSGDARAISGLYRSEFTGTIHGQSQVVASAGANAAALADCEQFLSMRTGGVPVAVTDVIASRCLPVVRFVRSVVDTISFQAPEGRRGRDALAVQIFAMHGAYEKLSNKDCTEDLPRFVYTVLGESSLVKVRQFLAQLDAAQDKSKFHAGLCIAVMDCTEDIGAILEAGNPPRLAFSSGHKDPFVVLQSLGICR
ncbi:hypothetical protein PsYK624_131930 [Phanerochaete sordida]|uniref:Uncharacterized protein n=1 Tax=Phanerochaete sordida TaxID=48140 RepID=A0A9P3GL81_9APHY|nr:hypothetical protein PsYK624_131930 [Phanerochaete sordida]